MFWTNTKRVISAGFIGFWRNGFVSFSSIVVMTITLFALGSLVFSNALLDHSLTELKGKVDVNVYFTAEATEEEILAMKSTIEELPETASVEYVSREDALEQFRERHKDDQLTLQALDELEENPLLASLNIRAKEPSQFESIANFLEDQNNASSDEAPIIDKVNYFQNKEAIDKLTAIIGSSEQANLAKTVMLMIVAILITFNTIRLAIYNSREEIGVMKLVGASNWYARGPFLVEGIMYGLVAAVIVLVAFYPITLWLGPLFYPFSFLTDFQEINLFNYYIANFAQIFALVIGGGILLGIVSSYLAVKRYLKI